MGTFDKQKAKCAPMSPIPINQHELPTKVLLIVISECKPVSQNPGQT